MSKPQPQRIPSDDCVVTINGTEYHPHEGEWVEVLAGMTVREYQALSRLVDYGMQLLAAQGEPDEQQQVMRLTDQQMDELCVALADRVLDWNWTDLRGRPLPKPDGTPEPLRRLQAQELRWLSTATQGERPADRGKGLSDSPITSSATPSRPSRE